ncbi:MAG: 16S rRNA (cytidine(1402)-2'-O)-methyltransferase [Candidatus Bipolaricaulota bacterium]|nr:16S rRNA (cytidine(1402)-2'-O)-methyltransferase [Candidatus Bipolaricaulota bacterium]
MVNSPEKPGKLYIVSLPIGNLEDITLRGIRALHQVDRVVAEDSRHTRRVLDRYRIKTPLTTSYYQGVEKERVEPLLSILREGRDLALVSDAGTPLISDPGYPLLRAALGEGIEVIPIPGPTALIAALVASGLSVARFIFDGTPPRKAGERRTYLEAIREERRTVVLYESPHRILTTLQQLAEILPQRRIVIARELTKIHEEFLRGTPEKLLRTLKKRDAVRGEYVILIEGAQKKEEKASAAAGRLAAILSRENISNKAAVRIIASWFDIPRNEAYRLVHFD